MVILFSFTFVVILKKENMERIKIRLNRKDLVGLLERGGYFSERNKVISILQYSLVSISGIGEISVYSTDSENGVRCIGSYVRGDDSIDFGNISFCVDTNSLLRGLKTLRDGDIELIVGDNSLDIVHSKGDMSYATIDSDDYPILDKVDSDIVYCIGSDLLRSFMLSAKSFVCTDSLRPSLCGVYLYIKDNKLGVCGTDTMTLYNDSAEYLHEMGDRGVIVPSSCIGVLLDLLQCGGNSHVKFNERGIAIKSGNGVLTCRVPQGTFPNFERVIPNSKDIVVCVNKTDFKDSANRILSMSDSATKLIKLDISDDSIVMEGMDSITNKRGKDSLSCEHVGADIKIGINGELLMRCIDSIDSDNIEMSFTGANRPILLTDRDNIDRRVIVMPMSLE